MVRRLLPSHRGSFLCRPLAGPCRRQVAHPYLDLCPSLFLHFCPPLCLRPCPILPLRHPAQSLRSFLCRSLYPDLTLSAQRPDPLCPYLFLPAFRVFLLPCLRLLRRDARFRTLFLRSTDPARTGRVAGRQTHCRALFRQRLRHSFSVLRCRGRLLFQEPEPARRDCRK